MAELAQTERLYPALLDRLTDLEPDKKLEAQENMVITRQKLREAVLRDLVWLFNTSQPGADELQDYAQVLNSTVNYGLPALSGQTASTLDVLGLEAAIKKAIVMFEPRILPETLEVTAVVNDLHMNCHNVVGVTIRGQLWGQPVPMELLLRTEVDLETGRMEIHDLNQGRR